MSDEVWLSTEELAAKYKVTPQTIYNWVKSGRIPPTAYIKPPGKSHYRFKGSEVETALLNTKDDEDNNG